jgi:Flp pilus assembly protein TadD
MPEEIATGAQPLPGGARVALSEVFGLSKKDLDSLEVLGFLLFEQGREKDAETIFSGLAALDSRRHTGFAGMGALALVEQKIGDAVKWLRDAVERNPNDPTVRANLGEALLKEGKFEEAAAEFEKALLLDPEGKDPGANRARAILSGMANIAADLQRNVLPPKDSDKGR